MIESIYQIGQSVIQSGDGGETEILKALSKPVTAFTEDKKQYIAILKLSTSPLGFDMEFREFDRETPNEYLWVDNSPRASFQDRLTSDNLSYLISQSIPTLVEKLADNFGSKPSYLKRELRFLHQKFFLDLGADRERYRYILNPGIVFSKLGDRKDKESKEAWRDLQKEWCTALEEKAPKELPGELAKLVKKHFKITKDVLLFTIEVDDTLLVTRPETRVICIH